MWAENLDTRQWPRKTVDKDAVVMFGQCVVHGTIRNMSAGGVFFEPLDGVVDFEFVHGDECLNYLEDDMVMEIDGTKFKVSSKWVGYQPNHQCYGVGAEFRGEAS